MSIFACSLELKCSNLLIIQKLFWETPSVLRRLADARSSRSWRWAASAKRLSAIAVAKRPLRSSSLMSSGTYLETEMATRELWGDISFRTDSASSRDGWDGRSQKQHRNQYVWSRERAFRKLICQLSWLRVIINRLGSFLALIALTWTPFPIWYSLRIAFENEISEWNWPGFDPKLSEVSSVFVWRGHRNIFQNWMCRIVGYFTTKQLVSQHFLEICKIQKTKKVQLIQGCSDFSAILWILTQCFA